MPSRGPQRGRNCYVTLHSPGSPKPSAGRNQELAASPVPSRGPKRGRNCYVTPAFTGVPDAKRGDKIRSGHLTHAFPGALDRAESLRNPCILGGPLRQARGKNQELATKSAPARGPKRVRICYRTPAFSGVPYAKRGYKSRIGHVTRAFSEAQKRVELLRNLCILGDPLHQARGNIKNWPPKPLGPRVSKRGRKGYAPAFSGVPCAKYRDKIRSGNLTRSFSGTRKRAEWLRNPCILGGPLRQVRGQIKNWPPNPLLLGRPKEGGFATEPLHSRGSPTPSAVTTSEVAT